MPNSRRLPPVWLADLPMGELIFNALLAVVGVVLYVMTYSFPTSIFDKSGGAGMYPRFVIIALMILLAVRTLQILKSPEEKHRKFIFFEMFHGPRLIYILTTLAYFLLVKRIGFIICTAIYLIGMILYLWALQEQKRPSRKMAAIVAAAVVPSVVALDWLFCEVMGVLLPAGILGF